MLVPISWDAVPNPLVTNYRAYFGPGHLLYTGAGSPVSLGNVLDGQVDLPPGTNFLAMTSVDNNNNESTFSNEVIIVVPGAGSPSQKQRVSPPRIYIGALN